MTNDKMIVDVHARNNLIDIKPILKISLIMKTRDS